jgi:hypothetical protein
MKPGTAPWAKLGLTETSYLLAYSQGYRAYEYKYGKKNCSYKAGTGLKKAFDKGYREAKLK